MHITRQVFNGLTRMRRLPLEFKHKRYLQLQKRAFEGLQGHLSKKKRIKKLYKMAF